MFISKRKLTDLLDRIGTLEQQVRDLQEQSFVYAGNDGLLCGWPRGIPLIQAVNSLAVATGHKWTQRHAVPATLEIAEK